MSTHGTVHAPEGGDAVAFRLLDLPPELQLVIYEMAVTEDDPIRPTAEDAASDRAQPPITRVSRAIRADALPMFYKNNTFSTNYPFVDGPDDLMDWLQAIGPKNRSYIRNFVVENVERRKEYSKEYSQAHPELDLVPLWRGRYGVKDWSRAWMKRIVVSRAMLRRLGAKEGKKAGYACRQWYTFPEN